MNTSEKQILIITGSVFFSILLILIGLTQFVHDLSIEVLRPLYEPYAKGKTAAISESIGYSVEIALAVLIAFTPLSAFSGIWFFKIAYELTLGKNAGLNIFIISPVLNWVMSLLCIIMAAYSFYSQYKWAKKLTHEETEKIKEDELAKFI